jgi:hypothetical protein
MKEHWVRNAREGVVLTIAAWVILFVYSAVKVIHDDSQRLADSITANQNLRTGNAELIKQRDALKDENMKLKNAPPKILTKTEPAPNEPRKCWLFMNRVNPNKDFDYAREIIVYCNSRTDPPARIEIEFDNEFVDGTVTVLGGGAVVTAGHPNRASRVFIDSITLPPILAYQP